MKKLFSVLIVSGLFWINTFASPTVDASQKVLDVFNASFNNASNVEWFSTENNYIATFKQNNIHTSITYDKDAHFISSRRYYTESDLPLNILLKIKEKYKATTIGIVTEIFEKGIMNYSINLEDAENVYVVETGRRANLHLRLKFKKQQNDK